jgi:hypothetical protein
LEYKESKHSICWLVPSFTSTVAPFNRIITAAWVFELLRSMKQCLILETGLPYMNFKTIGDYIILICYYLKLLKVSKTEIKAFIREFEKITSEYHNSVNPSVAAITIHPYLTSRMAILKNSI